MKHFADLFKALDQTTKTNTKVKALAEYFAQVDDKDRMWTMALLSHRRPKRTVTTSLLRQWAASYASLPHWLFEESYHVVGDLAETIALVLPPARNQSANSLTYWIDFIKSLGSLTEEEKREQILAAWDQLTPTERFVFNKVITGGLRIGVSQKLMVRALSRFTGQQESSLAHRLTNLIRFVVSGGTLSKVKAVSTNKQLVERELLERLLRQCSVERS